ncbi:MAG TPA: PAS domain-containing protein [Casimicrobiaceae bacterium]|nr:PAS domain-containing protein [Casimicrobiaceae bacterium]
MKSASRLRELRAPLLLASVIAALLALAYLPVRELRNLSSQVDQNHRLIERINEVPDQLAATASSQRAFLITNDLRYRKEFQDNLQEFDAALAALDAQTVTHPTRAAEMAQLASQARAARAVIDFGMQGFATDAGALQQLLLQQDRALDAVESVAQRAIERSHRELENLAQSAESVTRFVFAILAALAIASGSLLAWRSSRLRSEMEARRSVEQLLHQANAELEARVAARTGEANERALRFSSLVERIPGCVYRCANDADRTMLYASDAVEDITGLGAKEFLEHRASWMGLVVAEDRDGVARSIREAVERKSPFAIEYRIRQHDGTLRWLHERGRATFDAEGSAQYIEGVVFDISSRKVSEERLAQASTSLRDSEQRLRRMAEAIDEVFWMRSPDYQSVLYVSTAFERVWGRTSEELYANPLLWMKSIHASDLPRVTLALDNLAEGKDYDLEYRVLRPDATTRWVQDRGYALRDDNGKVTMTAGVTIDITERRAAEGRLVAAKRELETALELVSRKNQMLLEATRARSDFLATISHELRTPLNAIIGYSEMMEAGLAGKLSPQQHDFASDIHQAGVKLLGRITAILDYIHLDSGLVKPSPEPADPVQLIEDIAAEFSDAARKAGIELNVTLGAAIDRSLLDRRKIADAIRHLLGNAVKFTPAGGRVTISVRESAHDEVPRQVVDSAPRWLAFEVSDTGPGISHNDRHLLFEPFKQGERSLTRGHDGIGLGLALSQRLARTCGGLVSVESERGAGARFVLWIPHRLADRSAVDDAALRASLARMTPGETPLALVVEDDPEMGARVRLQLENEGLRVAIASTAEDALEMAAALHPQLITLDVLLPGMDGLSFFSRLKRDPTLADIPVIIISMVGDRYVVEAEGAASVLQKPLRHEQLRAALASLGFMSQRRRRVLIIDDDEGSSRLTAATVGSLGLLVTEAHSAADGIARAKSERPDLIILDLAGSNASGFEVVEALQAEPATRVIPVIIATAFASGDAAHTNEESPDGEPASRIPFSREQLIAEVRRALNQTEDA